MTDIEKIKVEAILGFKEAQHKLGKAYEEGEGVDGDIDEACKWYKLSAEQGHSGSAFALGLIYADKRYHSQNLSDYYETVYWHEQAVNSGHKQAAFNLAALYEDANVLGKRMHDAIEWYEKAAPSNVKAQIRIAKIYDKENDIFQAHKWYSTSILNGNVVDICTMNKCELFMTDEKIKESKKMAEEWVNQNQK